MQYNEAFGNVGPAGDADRGGFDADWNARNTIFQYNYSHDNNFAFAVMRRYQDGLRIHRNISENERYGFIFYGFPTENRIADIQISNNTFYSKYPEMQMFMNIGKQRDPINTSFVDNIFVFAAGGATWGAEPTTELGNFFENNLVLGLDEVSYTGPVGDPLLAAPGTGGTGIDMADPGRLAGYKSCIGSPAIGAGRKVRKSFRWRPLGRQSYIDEYWRLWRQRHGLPREFRDRTSNAHFLAGRPVKYGRTGKGVGN